jgi:hypothetical protein
LGACPGGFAEGDKPRCSPSGTHLLHCEKGKLASLNCGALGLKCAPQADGTSACATAGPACSAPNGTSLRCEGNVSVGCFNGHEVRVNCANAGLVCNTAAGPNLAIGTCAAPPAPGAACDPNERAQCDGSSIRFCQAGKTRTFSCKSAGFNRCEPTKAGVHCAP